HGLESERAHPARGDDPGALTRGTGSLDRSSAPARRARGRRVEDGVRAPERCPPMTKLSGALAAAVTPLRGDAFDALAVGPYTDFLAGHGLDGVLVLGTTGEGVLFSPAERREIAAAFVDAASGKLQVAVHCGAQTTRETAVLAERAAGAGADAGAGIAPPYFPLAEAELPAHFETAARACAPLPFYLYEFEARSGYAIPLAVIERLRERAPNLAGMKVSDSPWERLEPYLIEGLDVFVGAEALLERGLA